MNAKRPIGIIDSGVGGLTLVKELTALCPGEDIVFFGDSANCPYGNRPQEEIFTLALKVLRFIQDKDVKMIAIACNTISVLRDMLAAEASVPIFCIVSPVARAVAESGLDKIGVFATEFTVASGIYQKRIHSFNPNIKVCAKGSPGLAKLVDTLAPDDVIDDEIKAEFGAAVSREALGHVVLGCTHFPIVEKNFKRCFPQITYIDPAREQAKTIYGYLSGKGLLNPQGEGKLFAYTSGETKSYMEIIKRIGALEPLVLESAAL